jgi:TonB-linked SusC/RagA family outer membrane protein
VFGFGLNSDKVAIPTRLGVMFITIFGSFVTIVLHTEEVKSIFSYSKQYGNYRKSFRIIFCRSVNPIFFNSIKEFFMNTVDTLIKQSASVLQSTSSRLARMAAFVVFGVVFAFAGEVFAQVSGTVKDDEGAPLPGVSIRVKGANKGAVTNKQGQYNIALSDNDKVLVFSLVGYKKKEVEINGRSAIDMVLALDYQKLEDVVVVGYGSAIKREITGNIAKVKGSEIADMPVATIDAAIQGKAAGVVVQASSGKVGSGISIRVRGPSSLSASNEPLYVVDGIPISTDIGNGITTSISTNPLVDLNPQDIESIDVLKDAAAAAIYGARGANGVVLISTKRGKSGRTKVTISAQQGFSDPTKILRVLNAQEYVDYFRRAAAATDSILGRPATAANSRRLLFENILARESLDTWGTPDQANTDWSKEVLRTAPMTQIDFSVSGGSERTTFYASGQYLNQTGVVIGNNLERFTGRLNIEQKVTDNLTAGFNVSVARSLNRRLPGDNAFSSPMQAIALAPVTPTRIPKGLPGEGLLVGSPPGDIEVPFYYNPLLEVGNSNRDLTVLRNIGNVFGELLIIEGLKFRTEFGFDLTNQTDARFSNSITQFNSGSPQGFASVGTTGIDNFNVNSFFNFNRTFDIHTLDVTLGLQYQRSQVRDGYAEARDFPSDAFRTLTTGARKTDARSAQTDYAFAGYFARVNYKLSDRYLFSLSGRMEGSSRFGSANRYGFFPAASAGWLISQEDFWKDIQSTVSFLKLRASYGITGNAEIGNFASRTLVSGDAAYNGIPGTRPFQLGNNGLTWETVTALDLGLDFGFLDNRITGEIAVYDKRTTGMLLSVQVPQSTGFNTVVRNVGAMENQGLEITLNTDNVNEEMFSWRTSLNFATNRNNISALDKQVVQGGIDNMSRAAEGFALGSFFTVEYAGVDRNNGDALFYKNTLNADGTRDRTTTNRYVDAQRVYIGSALPAWTAGVTNTFRFFRDLEFSFQFNGQFGNLLNFFGVGRFSSANARFEDNQTADQLDSWTPTNRNARNPQARFRLVNGDQSSSRFIVDGSFVRLRNVTIAYNIPKSILEPTNVINSVRIFVTGQNLWTATSYIGWDPEVNADYLVAGGGSAGNLAIGYDFYTAPQVRTILFGVNIGF